MTTIAKTNPIVDINDLYFTLLQNKEFVEDLTREIKSGVSDENRLWFFKKQKRNGLLFVEWDHSVRFDEVKEKKALIKALNIFLTQEENGRAAEYVAYLAQLWVDNEVANNFTYKDYIFCCMSLDPALQAIFSGFNFLKKNDIGRKKVCNIEFENKNAANKDDTTGTFEIALHAKFDIKDRNGKYYWKNVANLFGALVSCRNYQDHTTKSDAKYFNDNIKNSRYLIKSFLVDLVTLVYFIIEDKNEWSQIDVPKKQTEVKCLVFKNPLIYVLDALGNLKGKSQNTALDILNGDNLVKADKLYNELRDNRLKWSEIKDELELDRQDRDKLQKEFELLKSGNHTTPKKISLLKDNVQHLKRKIQNTDTKIADLEQQQQLINSEFKQIVDNHEKRLTKVEEGLQRLFKWLRKAAKCVVIAISIVLPVLVGLAFLRYCPAHWFAGGENFAHLAYGAGNKEVAWQRAELLSADSTKQRQATYWYQKALIDLDNAVKNNKADSAHMMRLSRMLALGKGGVFDLDSAASLAENTNTYDYAALIYACKDNFASSKNMLQSANDTTTDYYRVANAWNDLVTARQLADSVKVRQAMDTLICKARTSKIAGQEACELLFRIDFRGLISKNGALVCSPNMWQGALNAKYAADKFNSLRACLALMSLYDYLGDINGLGTWYGKAKDLGFATKDNSKKPLGKRLRNNDPDALMQMAELNYADNVTYYETTALLYSQAYSVLRARADKNISSSIYMRWFDMVVSAEDLPDRASVLSKVRKDWPDSLRGAVADYVMAKRYCQGKGGVSQDPTLGCQYLQRAAEGGLTDAQFGFLLEQTRDNEVNKDSLDYAFEKLATRLISAAHYMLIENISQQNDNGVDKWLQFIIDKYPCDIKGITMTLCGMNLRQKSLQELANITHHIEDALSKREKSKDRFILFDQLSQIYDAMGQEDKAEFYRMASIHDATKRYKFEFNVFNVTERYFE